MTTSEKVFHDLPIPKGMQIILSIAACNRLVTAIFFFEVLEITLVYGRNKKMFGEATAMFKPHRCLRELQKTKIALGVYAGL